MNTEKISIQARITYMAYFHQRGVAFNVLLPHKFSHNYMVSQPRQSGNSWDANFYYGLK